MSVSVSVHKNSRWTTPATSIPDVNLHYVHKRQGRIQPNGQELTGGSEVSPLCSDGRGK